MRKDELQSYGGGWELILKAKTAVLPYRISLLVLMPWLNRTVIVNEKRVVDIVVNKARNWLMLIW